MDRETARKIILLYDHTSETTHCRVLDRLPIRDVVQWYNFKEVVKETLSRKVKTEDLRR